MSEPSQKCDNNAIFKQNYTQKLFISFKISYSCCFGFRENLEFPDFLQKSFITTTSPFLVPYSSHQLKRENHLLNGDIITREEIALAFQTQLFMSQKHRDRTTKK